MITFKSNSGKSGFISEKIKVILGLTKQFALLSYVCQRKQCFCTTVTKMTGSK